MKKFFIALTLMAMASQLFAIGIEKHFDISSLKTTQKGEYTLLQIAEAMNTAKAGQPLIPWYAEKILLPQGEEMLSYQFKGKHLTPVEGTFLLPPMQPSRPLSQATEKVDFVIDAKTYASDEAYPSVNYRNGGTHFWGGHSIGFVYYTPFVYHPQSGRLYYYQEIEISIETVATKRAAQAQQLLRHDAALQQSISAYVSNAEQLSTYSAYHEVSRTEAYDMLVVTPEVFKASFNSLKELYFKQGIVVKVVSIETIESTAAGDDLPMKIREYAKDAYLNNGLQYLLLAGDVEHVPYRGFYCSVQSSQVQEDDNIPADLYYSALDGTWNDNGNDKWGEIGEDDLLPELAVARLPFSNQAELDNMLNKTIMYQSQPVVANLNHPLMAGEHLYDDPLTYGSDYLELLFGYREDNGYATDGIPLDNPVTKLYDKESSWSQEDLVNEINSGKNFLHHAGHANFNTVMRLYSSDVTDANFSGANGVDNMFTNVYTHGCICGSFDASDCIAEHMLKIKNFAASFIGNSRYGWFNEGQTEGPSAHLHREYVNAIYHDSVYRIGAAHMNSKAQTAEWVNAPGQHEEGALRWCFYDCNALADPAMPLWTEEPEVLSINHAGVVRLGEEIYQVQVSKADGSPMPNAMVQIVCEGQQRGKAFTNANGVAQVPLLPAFEQLGTAELWVAAYNSLPQQQTLNIISASGACVLPLTQSYQFNDANANGLQEPGEEINLQMQLKNYGDALAQNVQVSLVSNSPYVTILQGNASCGDIDMSATYVLEDVFSYTIAENIPFGEEYKLTLNISSTNLQWSVNIKHKADAPFVEVMNMQIDDEVGGNGNARLDAGEEVQLIFTLQNNGASVSSAGEAELINEAQLLNIIQSNCSFESMEVNNTQTVTYTVQVPEDITVGAEIVLRLQLDYAAYHSQVSYTFTLGEEIEDWESNGFSTYEWVMDNEHPWVIGSNPVYEGNYVAQSADIDHNSSSALGLTFDALVDGIISFYVKVSSEEGYDKLHFYINEQAIEEWSGELDWTKKEYEVSAGVNHLLWVYSKDFMASSGADKAYIDYIVLPLMGSFDAVAEGVDEFSLSFYPNPVQDKAVLDFNSEQAMPLQCEIYDMQGRKLYESRLHVQVGKNTHSIDVNNLSRGTYLVKLTGTDNKPIVSLQFIKL